MTVKDVADKLGYNLTKFNLYLEYQMLFDNSEYISFEQFLLLDDNLQKYMEEPEKIKRSYNAYHYDSVIKDYESFEVFCDMLNLFPYDTSIIDEYRSCKNCSSYRLTRNLITGEEYYSCLGEFTPYEEYVCDGHRFREDKAKELILSLRK